MRWTEEQAKDYMAEYIVAQALHTPPGSTQLAGEADSGRESKLQSKAIKWANDKGYPVFHDRSRKKNIPGWPDLTICLPKGITLFLELKSAKGVLRKEQAEIRQQMMYLGHHYFIVKSFKQFLLIVTELYHET
jgi:hypothetical protein